MSDKFVGLKMSSDLDRKVRVEAAKRDLNRSAYIRAVLQKELEEAEQEQGEQQPATGKQA